MNSTIQCSYSYFEMNHIFNGDNGCLVNDTKFYYMSKKFFSLIEIYDCWECRNFIEVNAEIHHLMMKIQKHLNKIIMECRYTL